MQNSVHTPQPVNKPSIYNVMMIIRKLEEDEFFFRITEPTFSAVSWFSIVGALNEQKPELP